MSAHRSERVDRFLNRTLASIAEQKALRTTASAHGDSSVTTRIGDSLSAQTASALPTHVSTVSSTIHADNSLRNAAGVTASLLTIPYELRIQILEMVIRPPGQAFISSRQQVTASFIEDGDPASSTLLKTSTTDSEGKSDNVNSIKDTTTAETTSIDETKTKPRQTRFTHDSSTFRSYAESRHADTAVLYVCHQLRSEGLHLWYKFKYYLTLVIEQGHFPPPVRLLVDLNQRRRSSASSNGTGNKRLDTRTLQFNERHQELFWRHVRTDLRFPRLSVMQKFRKFHVSLFVEESAFAGVDAWRGVRDGLETKKIVEILMGDAEAEADADMDAERSSGTNTEAEADEDADADTDAAADESDSNGGVGGVRQLSGNETPQQAVHSPGDTHGNACTCHSRTSSPMVQRDHRYSDVRLADHTYLRLAGDANYETPSTESRPDEKETNLSLSIEMWRI